MKTLTEFQCSCIAPSSVFIKISLLLQNAISGHQQGSVGEGFVDSHRLMRLIGWSKWLCANEVLSVAVEQGSGTGMTLWWRAGLVLNDFDRWEWWRTVANGKERSDDGS